MSQLSKKQKIYRDYVTRGDKTSVQDIADKHKVNRSYVHQALQEITKGGLTKEHLRKRIKACMEAHRKQCLWECWFKDWYEAIGENIKGNVWLSNEFKLLVRTMKREKFDTAEIARLTNRDHATIRHHLQPKRRTATHGDK